MKYYFKILASLSLCFAIGIAIGKKMGANQMFESEKLASEMVTSQWLIKESQDAYNAYLTLEPSGGIYALKHFIDFLESCKDQKFKLLLDEKTLIYDLSLNYVRLGFLYEKINDPVSSKFCFSKAVEIYRTTGKKNVTLDILKNLVKNMDSNK